MTNQSTYERMQENGTNKCYFTKIKEYVQRKFHTKIHTKTQNSIDAGIFPILF